MRPSRPAAIAVIVGSLAAVGCVNPEPKEPLALGKDTQSILGGSNTATAKAIKPATFDPIATGGTGVTKENSFNRTVPGPGTGTTTGNFASGLPSPQIGQSPVAVAPMREGVSRGEPMSDQGRTAARAATPAPIPPVAPPAPVVGAAPPVVTSPFGQSAPKLDAPLSEPPVRLTGALDPAAPAPPKPIPPVMPEPERSPLPKPVMPGGDVAPIPPVAPPAPGAASNESLPLAPAVVPSPNDVPIPGTQTPPKLPPPPPILPNR